MTGWFFLVPTLLAITVSFVIVRWGAVALLLTGMRVEAAKFQALSAFTGTGFTTRESEGVINHPQRRRIVTRLMIMGNAGIVTVIASATTTFARSEGIHLPLNGGALVLGVIAILFIMSRSGVVERWERFVEGRLSRLTPFG